MAKRKRKTTHRRRTRRKGMSEGMGAKVKRRRSTGARGTALSTNNLIATGKDVVGGALGGYAGGKIYHMSASYTPMQKLLAFGVAAMAANMFGMPNVGAGIAGGYGFALATGQPGMQDGEDMEEHDYTDKEALEEMADAMDENGKPMYLASDGNLYYKEELEEMEEDDLSELLSNNQLLAEHIYPGYAQTY